MYFWARPATSQSVSRGTSTRLRAWLFSGSSSAASTASSFRSLASPRPSSVSSFSSPSPLSLSSSTASSYSSSPRSSASWLFGRPPPLARLEHSSCQSRASTRPVYSSRRKTRMVTHLTVGRSTLPDWPSCIGCSNMAAKASLAAARTTLCAASLPSARMNTTSSKRLVLKRPSYMSMTPSTARSASGITGSSSFNMPFHCGSLEKLTLQRRPSTEVIVPTSPGLTTPQPHFG
mmetsp:Transcript_152763/g.470391  ORF Transcript_152763/g.470391 Transcript_152763/m.470391 type:complete len:233 (+) Transcript_152763:320-1018(+)